MTKPTPKQIGVIKEVFEDSFGRKVLKVVTDGCLVSLLFPEDTKIPKNMPELKEELRARGYIIFQSVVIDKDEPVLSINLTKV